MRLQLGSVMLVIAFVAVAISAVTASLLWLSGYLILALALAPLAGSVGALGAALAFALLVPPGGPIRCGTETRAAIGAELRKLYAGIAQEPLPERLARIAAQLKSS